MGQFRLERINEIILKSISAHPWESGAVFNPAAVKINGEIHLLYRAVEGDNFSTIGYAKLDKNANVSSRLKYPVLKREWAAEKHGCEDPRIVAFAGRLFIFYTAYDGAYPKEGKNARVILAETENFTRFRKLGIIGPDWQDKDAMIFPEKIDGKVAYLHRIEPNIQLAFFDDIDHLLQPEANYWPDHMRSLQDHTILSRNYEWETVKIGVGPPPMRTEAGWLVIYHGVDKKRIYRAGAALLDEKNPFKIRARLPYPILEPEREYEKTGDVNMVVFPEGMVQFDDDLLIFYGAADKAVGLAACKLSKLIDALWKNKI